MSVRGIFIGSQFWIFLVFASGQPGLAQSRAPSDQIAVWKKITVGTHRSIIELREALEAKDCGARDPTVSGGRLSPTPCLLGDTANEIVGRLELTRTPTRIDLILACGKDLGFPAGSQPSLREIYDRAETAGYALSPPEAGPSLRLQYGDQKIGEFLLIGMRPIRAYNGDLTIFSVGNGGAGLLLIGSSGDPELHVPADKYFVFMRSRQARDDEVAGARGE